MLPLLLDKKLSTSFAGSSMCSIANTTMHSNTQGSAVSLFWPQSRRLSSEALATGLRRRPVYLCPSHQVSSETCRSMISNAWFSSCTSVNARGFAMSHWHQIELTRSGRLATSHQFFKLNKRLALWLVKQNIDLMHVLWLATSNRTKKIVQESPRSKKIPFLSCCTDAVRFWSDSVIWC